MERILFLIIFFTVLICNAQSDSSYYYFSRTTPDYKVLNKISDTKTQNLKDYYQLVYYSKIRETDSIQFFLNKIDNQKSLPENLSARFTYFKAYYYRIIQNDSLSFKFHTMALEKSKQLNDTLSLLASLSGLAQSYNYEEDTPYRLDYLEELTRQANNYNNSNYKIIGSFLKGNYYLLRDENDKAIEFYKKTFNNKFKEEDSSIFIKTLSNIAVLYNENLNMPDSALVYYEKELDIINGNKKFQSANNYFSTYLNLGSIYNRKNNYAKALEYLQKADSVDINETVLQNKSILKESFAKTYANLGDFKNAFHSYKDYYKLTDSINRRTLVEGIAKYENQELRIKNLKSESKRIQNKNLLIGSLALLAFGIITFLLIQKNTKKKQKLAEQEKALESQKLVTVLKEQELMAIDAMIEGQEKERQRIANDLHDDLGGQMANLKLHFSALKSNPTTALFNKTNNLIDEAYLKVRSVAHAKNAGVIAKEGLLKAVQNMADKISGANKIQIEVLDYG
ncbi:tetratricopeptide repeat-containing sensor histidine kinase, partial [Paucihalobacter sp.]|uniref:tetratricopeptide repeat-containing sensor histidine kinase n=1 Tax=Paucihalobacter sp. TaxID=2850405 RepID=UPI003D1608E9